MDDGDNNKHFKFVILQKDKKTKARLGRLATPHGDIETPMFIPVGTQATVKALTPKDLEEVGAQIVLANTYHLHLRPGEKLVSEMGGVAVFMGWIQDVQIVSSADVGPVGISPRPMSSVDKLSHNGTSFSEAAPAGTRRGPQIPPPTFLGLPTMTDSGGFQVFSLGAAHQGKNRLSKFSTSVFLPQDEVVKEGVEDFAAQLHMPRNVRPAKIDEEGVTFYSHLDGSEHRLNPESSIRIQEELGADLIVAFDDHESPLWTHEQTRESLERTNRWALQSRVHQKRSDQLMYGVVHGGLFEDLRKESADFTNKHFEAIAIGGAYTSKDLLYKVLEWSVPFFDEDKPRHLLGIGEPQDIFEGVERGMDFFDCVVPTRRARHGNIYLSPKGGGKKEEGFSYNIVNAQFRDDKAPLDPYCDCYTCTHFTRSYVHHLFRAKELLAYRLATYHNVRVILALMEEIRKALKEEQFGALKTLWLGGLHS